MEKGIIPIILGVMGVIVLALGVLIYFQLRPTPEIRYESDGDTEFAGPAIDSGARIEIEVLRGQLEACLLYTSPSPRDQRGSRMPSSA